MERFSAFKPQFIGTGCFWKVGPVGSELLKRPFFLRSIASGVAEVWSTVLEEWRLLGCRSLEHHVRGVKLHNGGVWQERQKLTGCLGTWIRWSTWAEIWRTNSREEKVNSRMKKCHKELWIGATLGNWALEFNLCSSHDSHLFRDYIFLWHYTWLP